MPVPLAPPLAGGALRELHERAAQCLDGVKGPHPEHRFRERADAPLGDAVALGLADERRTRRDPHEPQRILKGIADVLAAMIVPRLQTRRDPLRVGAEDRPPALAQGSTASTRVPGRAAWIPLPSAAP